MLYFNVLHIKNKNLINMPILKSFVKSNLLKTYWQICNIKSGWKPGLSAPPVCRFLVCHAATVECHLTDSPPTRQ